MKELDLNNYFKTVFNNYKIFIIVILFPFIASCSKIYVSKLQYDDANGFYRYPINGWMVPVRNDTGALISKSNLKNFLFFLDARNYWYNKDSIVEPDIFIRSSDDELVNLYNGIVSALSQENKDGAKFFISEFEKNCFEPEKYTDIDYWKGRYYELLEKNDSARYFYTRFLNFSGSKYSRLFRGYAINKEADECFTNERNYAAEVCKGAVNYPPVGCTELFKPKLYYQSFSQGYVVNREDFG